MIYNKIEIELARNFNITRQASLTQWLEWLFNVFDGFKIKNNFKLLVKTELSRYTNLKRARDC